MVVSEKDVIGPEQVSTLTALFRERVALSPDAVAYKHYDSASQRWVDTRWREMSRELGRWQAALQRANLQAGDRVALMLKNSREWILFDQAALGLGLVTVPIYIEDRADNAAYILQDANVKLIIVEGKTQWQGLLAVKEGLPTVEHILSVATIEPADKPSDPRLASISDWLFGVEGEVIAQESDGDSLASIVYTSGTTGHPKGVMLSHRNMLYNAWYANCSVSVGHSELFLSFLPLSHTLERTVGYYLPIMICAQVAFNRAIDLLAEDLVSLRPTVLVSVPRIYERVYNRITANVASQSIITRTLFALTQKVGWRRFEYMQKSKGWSPLLLLWPLLNKLVASKIISRLGGRIKVAICGGAALPPTVAKLFNSLGLNLMQGYGLTESSPVISVNRIKNNKISSIGLPLPHVEVRIADNGELQSKSLCVMMGYWNNAAATQSVMTDDGWLKTGDKASIDEDGYLYITGRLKEIIVLSTGEKVPPGDMEMAVLMDPLFEQVLLIGEARSYLSALIVINEEAWRDVAIEYGVDPSDDSVFERAEVLQRMLERVSALLKAFPGYAQVRAVKLMREAWTVDNGLLTATLKMKRQTIQDRYAEKIESMYSR